MLKNAQTETDICDVIGNHKTEMGRLVYVLSTISLRYIDTLDDNSLVLKNRVVLETTLLDLSTRYYAATDAPPPTSNETTDSVLHPEKGKCVAGLELQCFKP